MWLSFFIRLDSVSLISIATFISACNECAIIRIEISIIPRATSNNGPLSFTFTCVAHILSFSMSHLQNWWPVCPLMSIEHAGETNETEIHVQYVILANGVMTRKKGSKSPNDRSHLTVSTFLGSWTNFARLHCVNWYQWPVYSCVWSVYCRAMACVLGVWSHNKINVYGLFAAETHNRRIYRNTQQSVNRNRKKNIM